MKPEDEGWEQRQAEIDDALQKLNFLDGKGVEVRVEPNGEVGGFIPGVESAEEASEWDRVGIVYEDLHQMHKSSRGRSVILEAWERFREEGT